MGKELIARLHDGSEYVVKVYSEVDAALEQLTRPGDHRTWLDVEAGKIRYEAVAAFFVVEQDSERAINELLRELAARGGGTMEEVRRELDRRGIETETDLASVGSDFQARS